MSSCCGASRVQANELPTSDSAEEADLFAALTMVFLEPQQARRACDAVRGVYGAETFERLGRLSRLHPHRALLNGNTSRHRLRSRHARGHREASVARPTAARSVGLLALQRRQCGACPGSSGVARQRAALPLDGGQRACPDLGTRPERRDLGDRHYLDFFGVDRQEVLGSAGRGSCTRPMRTPTSTSIAMRSTDGSLRARMPLPSIRRAVSLATQQWRARGDAQFVGCSLDITDLLDARQRQEVLVAELQHRTRNLLGVVRSMSEATMRTSVDLADSRASSVTGSPHSLGSRACCLGSPKPTASPSTNSFGRS